MLTAGEARKLSTETMLNNSENIESFLQWVKDRSEEGFFGGVYCTSEYDFTTEELKYIHKLGYSVVWNSPCQFYEVAW